MAAAPQSSTLEAAEVNQLGHSQLRRQGLESRTEAAGSPHSLPLLDSETACVCDSEPREVGGTGRGRGGGSWALEVKLWAEALL